MCERMASEEAHRRRREEHDREHANDGPFRPAAHCGPARSRRLDCVGHSSTRRWRAAVVRDCTRMVMPVTAAFLFPSLSASTGSPPGGMPARRFDVIAFSGYNPVMATTRRSTVYFDPAVHRALRLHSAARDRTLSDVVNEMVRRALKEDLADLAVVRKRRKEPRHPLDSVVREMRRRGQL